MKNKLSNRAEVRENSLTVPMTSAEKDAVRARAQAAGLPMSVFVRYEILKFMKGGNE